MAAQRKADFTAHFTGPVYGVGLLFIFFPILDTIAQVWPPSVGSPSWRYGIIGIGANYLISVMFGLLLVGLMASIQWHRRVLRWLAIAAGVLAVLAVIASIGFVLDVLQLRPGLPRDNPITLRMFDIGAEKALFKYLVAVVAFAWLGFSAWRAARAIPAPAVEDDAPKLVKEQKGA